MSGSKGSLLKNNLGNSLGQSKELKGLLGSLNKDSQQSLHAGEEQKNLDDEIAELENLRNKNKQLLERAAEKKSPSKSPKKKGKDRNGGLQHRSDLLSGDGEQTKVTLVGSDHQTGINIDGEGSEKNVAFTKNNKLDVQSNAASELTSIRGKKKKNRHLRSKTNEVSRSGKVSVSQSAVSKAKSDKSSDSGSSSDVFSSSGSSSGPSFSSDTFSDSSSDSDSDSSDESGGHGLTFDIEGWNEPCSSVFVDNFIADMKVGYEC